MMHEKQNRTMRQIADTSHGSFVISFVCFGG
jgi:hypothetical protein